MAHRPFTRRQALQNQAFLEALRATGNPRLAARLLGVHRSTYTKRRAKNAAFAQDWDAALAAAHAAFHEAGGPRAPEFAPHPRSSRAKSRGAGTDSSHTPLDEVYPERLPQADSRRARDERGIVGLRTKGGLARRKSAALRTEGGELHVGRTRGGRLQLRRAPPGWMTKAGEQTFFRALSATANVRLSAAAAGFSHTAFYAKQRLSPAFAREMRLSLTMGYERVESAAIAAALPESHEDDAWRHNDPPPIPPMTPGQAIQLLCLHNKTVRLSWDRPHRRKRRGEPWETYTQRLSAMWTAEKGREAEDAALRRAAQYEATGDWRYEDEILPGTGRGTAEGGGGGPALPALEQVTGWSKAKPDRAKAVYNPDLALFGGWRLEDWEKRKRSRR